jgi:hypothetical protein
MDSTGTVVLNIDFFLKFIAVIPKMAWPLQIPHCRSQIYKT